MKQKKIPLRMCVVTRERFMKQELLRVVRTPEGEVKLDLTSKMNGKGAYVKKDEEAIKKAQKSKVLDRILEIEVPNEVYEEMLKTL